MTIKNCKVEVLIPEVFIVKLRNRLNEMGVLKVGKYDHVLSYSEVRGYWRPLEGANPYDGEVGKISSGSECKMEFRCPYESIGDVKRVIKSVHPYEEPIINVFPLL
ncbi:cytochrome C biogenesis protein [Sporolactobacillus pectinivorans]|uniref:cytochrome C biogenesis protein n=1 Tax=Sporolactobacillus pectinivorans TaxID=1591408 RepID=UPI000C26B330|nr:cytochrome C biogenesis protein [Sporolactobacillus pectinivorans]